MIIYLILLLIIRLDLITDVLIIVEFRFFYISIHIEYMTSMTHINHSLKKCLIFRFTPIQLVDSDVVDDILLGELSWTIRISWPVTTYGKIQNNEEFMALVEWPVTTRLTFVNSIEDLTIEIKLDVIGLPVDSIGMEPILIPLRSVVTFSGVEWWSV